jgi:ATP-binding cassette subfamily F protein 3
MTILSVTNLAKYFGAEHIFSGLTFQVQRGEKVALVGPNGAGKSTLLKIVAGMQAADEGSVQHMRGSRLAYLAQEVRFAAGRTLWQEMEDAFAHLAEIQAELSDLEPRIADTSAATWEADMERYGELSTRFEHAGGYEIERRIEMVLQGLNFRPEQYNQPLDQFSGGQKTRAGLAAALLSDPDLLLLDEPTNHLDLETLEWLETFLRGWDGTLLVTSHDRYFLERTTKRTLDIDAGTLEDYPASYNGFLQLKAERLERRMKEYQAQQEYIARTEEFIRRYKAGQRSKEARGREKRLDRYKEQQAVEQPNQPAKQVRLNLDSQLRSGEMVLALRQMAVGYGQHVLMQTGEHEIHRGERVALLGPNGSGKTTLLRTLLGQLAPLKGAFHLGHHVAVSYYAQGHDALRLDATVLDEILRVNPNLGTERARTLLGSFLFSGDDVFKRVGDLSGGERSRVAIAGLTLLPGNLLVLDEPTNHLDINAREVLEAALKDYPGAMLFVSHDRQFIDALADKLWVIGDGRLTEHRGNYTDYAARLAALRAAPPAAPRANNAAPAGNARAAANTTRPAQEDRQRKKRLAALEAQVETLEQELARIRAALEEASAAQDVERITALGSEYTDVEARLDQCYADWAELAA